MRLFDAHNHLQDERFGGGVAGILQACRDAGVIRMVVNGSCEADWTAVADLALAYPDIVQPAFGLHPWYLRERSVRWKDTLQRLLDTVPGATVGEIGLDRWILESPPAVRATVSPGLATLDLASFDEQQELFAQQMALAAERNLPASLHCLRAWGALDSTLRCGPRPARGFLLHSYGGPQEMVPVFSQLGAFFSFPGYFLHARKARHRETFRVVPPDRLLVETDAPDQRLPADFTVGPGGRPPWTLLAPDGRPLNHPANLPWVLHGLAFGLSTPAEALAGRLEANFERLFGQPPR